MRTRIAIITLVVAATVAWGEGAPSGAADEPLTWDNLPRRLDDEVARGFSGVVVVRRDGKTALEGAFGLANREKNVPNRIDTIFGIGSTPIDFTHVGILMLAQQGKLSLDDPVTEFFGDVPADKRGITVDHLRTGRSGLRDFHDMPSDGNPDHAWIDRDEAVRRILGQELRFEPGTGRAHSHSAWGLLAAILEIASGESYEEFATKRIFEPLGMKDTGFYGKPIPEKRMAVGYGLRRHGEVNAPPWWGRTSWLVMGSGGQTSIAGDMIRFVTGIRAGKLLEPPMRERMLESWDGIMAGGSVFGYEIVYTTDPDDMVIVLSNYNPQGGDSPAVRFAVELAELALGNTRPPFSLGVGLEFDPDDGLTISGLKPGGAAERDGLKPGDRLLAANGAAFGDDPMAVLNPLLEKGSRIEFTLLRDGEERRVTVMPNPR